MLKMFADLGCFYSKGGIIWYIDKYISAIKVLHMFYMCSI